MGSRPTHRSSDGVADRDDGRPVGGLIDGYIRIVAVGVLDNGDIAGAEVQPRIEGGCAVTVSHVRGLILPHIIIKAPTWPQMEASFLSCRRAGIFHPVCRSPRFLLM